MSIIDILKKAEGFKGKPYKSAEGGTDTVGYGHKLTSKEQAGDFVVLPDGTTVDLSKDKLTEDQALELLKHDFAQSKLVAKKQWNAHQSKGFDSLSSKYQNLLAEISFNTKGGLANGGTFHWPKLAKAMLDNNDAEVKNQLGRTYTNAKGQKVEMTTRVNLLKQYVDTPDDSTDILPAVLKAPQDLAQSVASHVMTLVNNAIAQSTNATPQGSNNVAQTSSQDVSEPSTSNSLTPAEQALIDSATSGGSTDQVKTQGEADLKARYDQIMAAQQANKEAAGQSSALTPAEQELIDAATNQASTGNDQNKDSAYANFIQQVY